MQTPTVLIVAGFDPYGGAGILADTKTVHALGGYALGVVTALTAQNSQGVQSVEPVSADTVVRQLEVLLEEIRVDAVKIGMVSDPEVIDAVAHVIRRHQLTNVVLDPVRVSSSGMPLLPDDAIDDLARTLLPLCRVVTPNLDETNAWLRAQYSGAASEIDMMTAGMRALGASAILFKGGHLSGPEAIDTLVEADAVYRFRSPKIITNHTHGTGCILSSAIATHLARGETLPTSVRKAKAFLQHRLETANRLQLHYHRPASQRNEPLF